MTKEEYKEVRNEIGKDGLKAFAFFFIGLPLAIFALVAFLMS